MVDDIVKSIKAALYERTSSPLFGAFSLSWVIWNYKLILVLLSKGAAQVKIEYIDGTLYPEFWPSSLILAFGPLATALIFLYGYPYPAKWVYSYWQQKQKDLRDLRQKIEGETLLTEEQSRRIRGQIIEIQSEYDRQIERNEADISKLKSEILARDGEISKLKLEIKEKVSAPSVIAFGSTIVAASDIAAILRMSPYRLYFNPEKGRPASKIMMFGPSGAILEGKNDNENSWRVEGERLELVQSDGKVHSRFYFNPNANIFIHTNDEDTRSIKGQYLIPEPDAAQQFAAGRRP